MLEGRVADASGLERALVTIVRKAHFTPRALCPDDLSPLREACGDEAIEYALVLGQFHYINRIADLLGVELEIPRAITKRPWLRRVGLAIARSVLRRTDLRARSFRGAPMPGLCRRLGSVVNGFDPASLEPLAGHPALAEYLDLSLSVLLEHSTLRPAIRQRIFEVVDEALPSGEDDLAGIHPRPKNPVEAFAFVGTRYAYRSTSALIDALRGAGHDDLAILDIAVAVSLANQWARQFRLLGIPALAAFHRAAASKE